jgi:hypothetical protein
MNTSMSTRIKRGDEIRIIIRQDLCPGDVLTLTAGVRDFKKAYPKLKIMTKTSAQNIWDFNPHLSEFNEDEAHIDFRAGYPLINSSNQCGKHMIHGFKEDIERELGVTFPIKKFKCDVHLSGDEKGWINQVEEVFGHKGDFWLINAGSKDDFPLKQWPADKWQSVVDILKDAITFVQVGSDEHNHIPLEGTLDLVGKTDLRQLIRLAYHCKGGFGHVSMLNHLLSCWDKPSIVVAGGRETATWEAYNTTQYLHTIGGMECCKSGGCWKSVPEKCLAMGENKFPNCMNIIEVADVVRAFRKLHV